MSVKLRLRRGGRKGQPHYRIVAADSRSPRDGKFLEQIGTYDPMRDPAAVSLDHNLALKWLRLGAQPTDTVRSFLSKEGIMLKLHLIRKGKNDAEIEAAYAKWKAENERKLGNKASAKASAKATAETQRMDAEKAKRAAIATRVAEKNTPPAAEPVAEAPAPEPVAEAPAPEPVAEAPEPVAEAPAPEPVAEAPAPEPVAEAPAPEPVAEAPAAEAEEPKTEA